MRRKAIALFVVILLFGGAAFALLGTKEKEENNAADTSSAAVKICPHSGLPCDGDGDCQDEESQSCGSDCSKEIEDNK